MNVTYAQAQIHSSRICHIHPKSLYYRTEGVAHINPNNDGPKYTCSTSTDLVPSQFICHA